MCICNRSPHVNHTMRMVWVGHDHLQHLLLELSAGLSEARLPLLCVVRYDLGTGKLGA